MIDPAIEEVVRAMFNGVVRDTLSRRAEIEQAEPSDQRARDSETLVRQTLEFCRILLGETVIADSYGEAPDGDRVVSRRNRLAAIERRLRSLRSLYVSVDRGDDDTSLLALADEIRAIRHGDDPKLLAPLGRRIKYRQHLAGWEALELDAFGEGLGISAAERRRTIEVHFGHMPWDTISRWGGKFPKGARIKGQTRFVRLLRQRRDGERSKASCTFAQWERMVSIAGKRWASTRSEKG